MGCPSTYSIAGRSYWSWHAVMPMQASRSGSALPLWARRTGPGVPVSLFLVMAEPRHLFG
jgi:hypothetical protein